jgi:hypothetical protein
MRVFHFLNAKYALQSLRTGRLKVARIDELDDPFELIGADLRDPKVRRGFQKNKERCAATFGYLSFTRRWQNLMLWSKYADRHQGVVLEIEFPDEAAIPVRYQKHRLKLDVAKIMASGGVTQEHVDAITATKSKHWEYQEEVRAAVSFAGETPENGHYFADVDIRGIVIGALSQVSEAQIGEALPHDKRIKVTHARLAFGSYDIVRRKDVPVKLITGKRRALAGGTT